MKLIVAGSRTFLDQDRGFEKLDRLTANVEITEVVSGGAIGADNIGELWAEARGIPVKMFKAEWDKHGKKTGFLRNVEMAQYAQDGALVAFWDGKSRGTKHMIEIANSYNMKVRVIKT